MLEKILDIRGVNRLNMLHMADKNLFLCRDQLDKLTLCSTQQSLSASLPEIQDHDLPLKLLYLLFKGTRQRQIGRLHGQELQV